MTLNASGYLGIGATSPNSQLDIRFPALTPGSQVNQILLQSLSNGVNSGLGARTGFTFNNRTLDYSSSGGVSTAGVYGIDLDPSFYGRFMGLVFYTSSLDAAATEKMRIDSAGNVGIGVTPSVWGGYDAGTIQKSYGAFWASQNNQTAFGLNSYFNGSNWIYSNSNNASIYAQASGQHIWYTAPSGTAGNAITFTQAMTLNASGNLAIGNTAPQGPLDVRALSIGGNGFPALVVSSDNTHYWTFASAYVNSNADLFFIPNSKSFYDAKFTLGANGAVTIASLGTGTVYSSSGILTSTNPSDSRLKTDITDLTYGLSSILALRPVSYKWKSDTVNQGTQYGFIAQEVQTVMPELVKEFDTTEDGEKVTRLGLEKEGIYAALVKSVQELNANLVAELQSVRQRLATLESK
jgi:hypothetical protein